jgi:hypothetical protein
MPDLQALVEWLIQCGIDTAAMASTGVSWVPIVEMLEPCGITPSLVHTRQVKTVPGRKSDWNDAQWLQKRQTLGWLQGAFRPNAERCVWRTRLRHRAELLAHRAPHILHRQKALNLMNLQWSDVLTDITGVTGQAILRAIVHGERDPLRLAQWRHPACQSSADDMATALTGIWQEAHLFILKQALEMARVVYHLLMHRDVFQAESVVAFARKRRERALKHLTRRANNLGDTLIPVAASPPVPVA